MPYIIRAKTGEFFCNKKQLFVHHSKGKRYGTRAMAQKSLNAAIAKNPTLQILDPVIVTICTN